MGQVRELCDHGAVLENGELTFFEDVDDAVRLHAANLRLAGGGGKRG